MIWQVNKTLTIPFLVTDTYGVPIVSGVTPTCTIRKSDGQYWNGNTQTWQVSEYANPMTHSFKGVWVFNFTPTIEDQFVVRTSESVNRVEGGTGFSTATNLNNSDVKTSTRSTVTESSIWSHNGRSLTSFGTLVNDIAVAVWGYSNRILTGFGNVIADIWNYSSRSLSPSNTFGIGSCEFSITLANGINVELYNSVKTPLFQGVSESNNVTFNINPGTYYLIFSKDGFFTKQEELIIPNVVSYLHSVELSPIVNVENLNIRFRELATSNVYVNDSVKLQLELYETSGKSFNITSVSATDGTNNYTTTFSGNRVYVQFNPSESKTYSIDVNVTIGGFTYSHLINKKVV